MAAEVDRLRWVILDGLFRGISGYLGREVGKELEDTGTMQQLAKRAGPAGAAAFGWPDGWLGHIHGENRVALARVELSQHPLAHCLVHDKQLFTKPTWTGSAYDLTKRLALVVPKGVQFCRDFPSSPAALTRELRNIAPMLATAGIDVVFTKTGKHNTRVISITRRN